MWTFNRSYFRKRCFRSGRGSVLLFVAMHPVSSSCSCLYYCSYCLFYLSECVFSCPIYCCRWYTLHDMQHLVFCFRMLIFFPAVAPYLRSTLNRRLLSVSGMRFSREWTCVIEIIVIRFGLVSSGKHLYWDMYGYWTLYPWSLFEVQKWYIKHSSGPNTHCFVAWRRRNIWSHGIV